MLWWPTTIGLFSLLFHRCSFANAMNHNANVFCGYRFAEGVWGPPGLDLLPYQGATPLTKTNSPSPSSYQCVPPLHVLGFCLAWIVRCPECYEFKWASTDMSRKKNGFNAIIHFLCPFKSFSSPFPRWSLNPGRKVYDMDIPSRAESSVGSHVPCVVQLCVFVLINIYCKRTPPW